MTSRRRRTQTTLWALVILASMAPTAAGLLLTFSLIRTPETYAREGPGHALIFAGALASAAAATWARLRSQGLAGHHGRRGTGATGGLAGSRDA